MKLKYYFSLAAGFISATVVGYSLLAPVWHLELADKVFSTGSILVMVLSMILSVLTGEKITKENTPEAMLEETKTGEIFQSVIDIENENNRIE